MKLIYVLRRANVALMRGIHLGETTHLHVFGANNSTSQQGFCAKLTFQVQLALRNGSTTATPHVLGE